jgi:6-phosphogluconolactonase
VNGDVQIVDDVPSAFAAAVVDAFKTRPNPDSFTIALSGGSTATSCYEALVDTDINWNIVNVIWGDERCVSKDHDDSNYLLAKNALLDKVGPFASVHHMDCNAGASAYAAIVRELLPIDVVHLGMGPDGHTASLFPGSPSLNAPAEELVLETGDDLHEHPRMTLTYSAIDQSLLAVFTVVGASKTEMFKRIEAGEDLPAARITAKRVLWLADPAAAGARS